MYDDFDDIQAEDYYGEPRPDGWDAPTDSDDADDQLTPEQIGELMSEAPENFWRDDWTFERDGPDMGDLHDVPDDWDE